MTVHIKHDKNTQRTKADVSKTFDFRPLTLDTIIRQKTKQKLPRPLTLDFCH